MIHRDRLPRTALLLVLPMLLAGCGADEPSGPPEPPAVSLPLTVARLEEAPGGDMASGTVEADDRVRLLAQNAGVLRAPDLHEGQAVRRGQILATIDPRQTDATVRRARAALEAALSEQQNADADVARDAPLAQSGALAGDAYRKELLRAKAAAAGAEQARAALAAAAASGSDNSIESPIDGVVVARHLRDGELAMPGAPVATVESSRRLVFRFAAPLASLQAFKPGSVAPVWLDRPESGPVEGRVRAVVPSADPATRRYTVEVALPHDGVTTAGMFGRVRLPSTGPGGDGRMVTAPAAAVVERGGLSGVFVVGPDRRATFRWVRLGERAGDRVGVLSGLGAGETIVARADARLRDGARVNGRASP